MKDVGNFPGDVPAVNVGVGGQLGSRKAPAFTMKEGRRLDGFLPNRSAPNSDSLPGPDSYWTAPDPGGSLVP